MRANPNAKSFDFKVSLQFRPILCTTCEGDKEGVGKYREGNLKADEVGIPVFSRRSGESESPLAQDE